VKRLQHWLRSVLKKRQPGGVQIRLSQRSIFVLPSGFAFFFALAVLLILLVAVNYRSSLAYALCFLLLSLFFIALLHSFRNLSGLKINAETSPPVFVGQQASFRLRLSSNKRAHQSIAIGFNRKALQVQDVPAAGSIGLELDCPATERGWLKPTRLLVESHFPLGLWRVWSWIDLEQRILVYPRPLAADLPPQRCLADDIEGEQSNDMGVDDFQGLRLFAPGDSLRRIHWKAFSRGRGLLVKKFCTLEGSALWLDFSALEGDMETKLSVLCHQVLKLCENRQRFGLRLPRQSISLESDEAQRDSCLQALALYGKPV